MLFLPSVTIWTEGALGFVLRFETNSAVILYDRVQDLAVSKRAELVQLDLHSRESRLDLEHPRAAGLLTSGWVRLSGSPRIPFSTV